MPIVVAVKHAYRAFLLWICKVILVHPVSLVLTMSRVGFLVCSISSQAVTRLNVFHFVLWGSVIPSCDFTICNMGRSYIIVTGKTSLDVLRISLRFDRVAERGPTAANRHRYARFHGCHCDVCALQRSQLHCVSLFSFDTERDSDNVLQLTLSIKCFNPCDRLGKYKLL
jgi:hypothetical protein